MDTMDKNEETAKMIENLAIEEEAENNLISIYLALLDFGVEGCIDEEERANFRKDMDILYKESLRHKDIVIRLISKYKKD
ncbi:MAG: hypothetical protein AAB721_02480 [Patescibacteria group bacterium]